ncbi:MAG: PadR family transcriptional regulator [Candidatus Izemoplasmatales bacterium]|nr:PadR family transcriptional regulator [Candidatus Izemoplasmatales bacterium]MDD4069652.1 PadR family transcriptional regulator [Candidatus Izemoplasmatales bacterium]
MINSDVIRGHIETIILKLLIEKDMYGYELVNLIKNRTNNLFQIKEATLYAVLQRLEKKELISSYLGEKTFGGKRRYYRVTPLGRAYFKEMLEEWNMLRKIMFNMLGDHDE